MMTRVAAYCRYSTDKQTENSIEYQLSAIKKYCKENDIQLVKSYIDEGYSGTNTDRPAYQNCLNDVKKHQWDAVCIYDMSRGSRDIGDWNSFRKYMTINNIKVISVTEQLGEYSDPNAFLVENVNMLMNQHFVLDTRKKSLAGSAVKAKKALFMGGIAPFGYYINSEGKYCINEQEAKIIEKIFEMYAYNKSYTQISEFLQKKGIRTRKGNIFTRNTMNSILKNEKYIGVYTFNKYKYSYLRKYIGKIENKDCIKIENAIPAIIDLATWELVRRRMEMNLQGQRKKAIDKEDKEFLLKGLITCPFCGSKYIAKITTSGKGYRTRYYGCPNSYHEKRCPSMAINADRIEDAVIAFLKNDLTSEKRKKDIKEAMIKSWKQASVECKEEKNELAQVNKEIKNMLSAIKKGLIFSELESEISRCQIRKKELEEIIEKKESKTPKELTEKELNKIFDSLTQNVNDKEWIKVIKRYIIEIRPHQDNITVDILSGVLLEDSCGGRI